MGWLRERRVLVGVAAAYLVGLAILVAGPWGWALNRLTVALYVRFRFTWPIAPDWVSPDDYGTLLNVVLFVPLGALVVLLVVRPWWWAALAAALGSTAIEVVQALWLAREGTWVDVAANTLGATIGALAVTPLARRRSRRAGPRGRPRRP
ncbi:glycopeptide antibiotics resistance protein [Nocardioides cavernae]|uniref:Glycopeptide antibiotics resistance protein n=1 Tax=Nocardioides cavernae TaxID=1921566 RepID=A0A7Y9KRW8_9ACTN|nr:VanZ family protein [Nocardioides cavernae]NYE35802.1 glycopeptide antibiotics resistance protein [Nocardioides cavernae]